MSGLCRNKPEDWKRDTVAACFPRKHDPPLLEDAVAVEDANEDADAVADIHNVDVYDAMDVDHAGK